MGASSWYYFIDFDPDAETALQRLRHAVFESGNFGDALWREDGPAAAFAKAPSAANDNEGTPDIGAMAKDMPWPQRLFLRSAARRAMAFHERIRKAATIDEALELADSEGTHSILDIESIGEHRDFGVAAPLERGTLVAVFGTAEPTRGQVEELWAELSDDLERWQAIYFPVFKDGRPHEYVFIGCSGD